MFVTVKTGSEVKELLEAATNFYENERKALQAKADSNVYEAKKLLDPPKPKDYEFNSHSSCNLSNHPSYWFKFKTYYDNDKEVSTIADLDARMIKIREVIAKYVEDCEKVYKENLEAIEHNKDIHIKAKAFMKAIGIPDSTSEYAFATSRSRTRKLTTTSAGYLGDLTKHIKTTQPSVPKLDHWDSDLRRKYDTIRQVILDAERKAKKEKEDKENIHKVALLRAKYTPNDPLSGPWELKGAILAKDKYLHLAHYLERNRGDWSDGFGYAETGIDNFSVEEGNIVDQEIYDCIYELVYGEDTDRDGRVFRDCEYNYGVLYGMVKDQTLISDLQNVKAWMGEDY